MELDHRQRPIPGSCEAIRNSHDFEARAGARTGAVKVRSCCRPQNSVSRCGSRNAGSYSGSGSGNAGSSSGSGSRSAGSDSGSGSRNVGSGPRSGSRRSGSRGTGGSSWQWHSIQRRSPAILRAHQ